MKKFLLIISVFSMGAAFGQTIENLTLTNAYTNEAISLNQYTTPIVVVFTSNECPFDNYYKTRIKEMIATYEGKVQFLLINSNLDSQDSPEKMAIHNTDLGIPYLADKEQKAMEAFGARKSPEAFLLKSTGDKFTIQYSGAIDDNPQVATDVKQAYLKEAIEKVLNNKPIEVANNRAAGCTIRRK